MVKNSEGDYTNMLLGRLVGNRRYNVINQVIK
jgi:hypothetical protein